MRFGEDLQIQGMVWPDPPKEKVAIIGFADSWKEAPFNDDSWEIWGLNSLFEMIPRWTRWFDIHDRFLFKIDTDKTPGYGLTRTGKPYMQALAEMKCPIYMVERYSDIPMALRFPIELMIAEFNPDQTKKLWPHWNQVGTDSWSGYVTNSISCMIAMAIMEGFKEIGLWGVDMSTTSGWNEYAFQRPSCEYYLGIAQGRGIKVTVPHTSDLLKNRFIYGWEDTKEDKFCKKIDTLIASMNQRYGMTVQQNQGAQKALDQYIGAMECAKEIKRIWGNIINEKEGQGLVDRGPVNPMFSSTQ